MSLVSVDQSYVPRVGPKVFADVPSQAEVQGAKRRSAFFLLLTLFLVGLLVAAGLVIGYFLQQDYPEQSEPGGAKKQIEALTTERDTLSTRVDDLEYQVAPFSTLSGAEGDAAVTIGRIQELLQERPGARERLATLYRDQWAAYDRLRNRTWVPERVGLIQADARTITPLVEAIRRVPTTPGTGGGTGGGAIIRECNPLTELCPPRRRPS